jgi:hypothetical protein
MTKNLEAADKIAKLTLSLLTVVFYFSGVIEGPFAGGLMIVSVVIMVIYFVKMVFPKDS